LVLKDENYDDHAKIRRFRRNNNKKQKYPSSRKESKPNSVVRKSSESLEQQFKRMSDELAELQNKLKEQGGASLTTINLQVVVVRLLQKRNPAL
jgi:flagellar hook-associated protein FlgK